jgi:TIR domain
VLASQRLRRSYDIELCGDNESYARLINATNVQLTAFYPQRIRPDFWYNLVAYVHLLGAQWAVRADSKKFLSVGGTPLGEIGRLSEVKIAPGAEIMAIPELTGCRFNPESVRLRWLEDWHRAEFRLQTGNSIEGFAVDRALNGRVAFYVEGLLVGETPIWSYVSENTPVEEDAALKDASTSLFQAIFASYSHEDFEVVESLAKAYKALGNSFVYDAESLRSGEKWNERLLELIGRVDIFQLYWSEAAKRSRNVENEWRCALALNRSAFIRPVYWHQPMAIPPHELADIHFAYCAMQARPLG